MIDWITTACTLYVVYRIAVHIDQRWRTWAMHLAMFHSDRKRFKEAKKRAAKNSAD